MALRLIAESLHHGHSVLTLCPVAYSFAVVAVAFSIVAAAQGSKGDGLMLKMARLVGALCTAASLAAIAPAQAATFATFNPVGTTTNLSLSGLTMTSASAVTFNYLDAGLSALGDLNAELNLTATETAATALGPLTLGTFDGSFSLTYMGPTKIVGGFTVHNGDYLLSGTFTDAVFTGYGSTASVIDSILGGGSVAFDDSAFITFGAGDEGLAIGVTSVSPISRIVGGQLSDFTGVSQGSFSADSTTVIGGGADVPEPAIWVTMLVGVAITGAALRSRRLAI
jgi:hypothetical protein